MISVLTNPPEEGAVTSLGFQIGKLRLRELCFISRAKQPGSGGARFEPMCSVPSTSAFFLLFFFGFLFLNNFRFRVEKMVQSSRMPFAQPHPILMSHITMV